MCASPRARWSTARCATLVLLSSGLAACSLAFVEGPPPPEARQIVLSCTESWVAPVLDVVAVGVGVRGLLVAEDDFFSSRQEKAVVSAAWSALFASSALVGFRRVRDCRRAHRELTRSVAPHLVTPTSRCQYPASPCRREAP